MADRSACMAIPQVPPVAIGATMKLRKDVRMLAIYEAPYALDVVDDCGCLGLSQAIDRD